MQRNSEFCSGLPLSHLALSTQRFVSALDAAPAGADVGARKTAAHAMYDMDPPLGLIAGEGVFPMLVARGAKAAGRRVVCAVLTGNAWPELREECDWFKWVSVVRLGQWARVLRSHDCHEAIMVGRVLKTKMYSRWRY